MNEGLFWIIFWSVILVCIVIITFFLAKTLFELSKDLRKLRGTLDNANEISSYIADGTRKTSDMIDTVSKVVPLKIFASFFKSKKKGKD